MLYFCIAKHKYIKHYLHEKKEVPPLWVLINRFTFGDLSRFYTCLPGDIQLNICKKIEKERILEYGKDRSKHFGYNIHELETALRIGCHFRNICAHDGRLFNSVIKHSSKTYHLGHIPAKIKSFVSKQAYAKYKQELISLRENYLDKFPKSYDIDYLFVKKMNFNQNWMNIL